MKEEPFYVSGYWSKPKRKKEIIQKLRENFRKNEQTHVTIIVAILIFTFVSGVWAVDVSVAAMINEGYSGGVITTIGTRSAAMHYHVGLIFIGMSFMLVVFIAIIFIFRTMEVKKWKKS